MQTPARFQTHTQSRSFVPRAAGNYDRDGSMNVQRRDLYQAAKEAQERAGEENVRIPGWAPDPNYRVGGFNSNSRSRMKASLQCAGRPP
jgi:hypothetical protein